MSTIEEVYYRVKRNANPSMAAMYMYMRLKDGIVHIDSMVVSYATDEEKNIARMEEKSRAEGFMFFAESDEGLKWRKENMAAIRDAYASMVMRF